MIRNLFKVAFRNFIREKFYTALNVTGLAVGIAVTMLIAIYILSELSYDRFHSKADRMYRLVSHLQLGSNKSDGNSTFPPMASALKNDLPEIEYALRLTSRNDQLYKVKEMAFNERNTFYADPEFFKVFDFKLIQGNPSTALDEQNKVVLTPAIAEKYFQTTDWSKVIGQSIQISDELLEVTGIIEEAPSNSHFSYSAIASMRTIPNGRDETWNSMNLSTYLVLNQNGSINSVIEKIPAVIEKYNPGYADLPKQGIIISFDALALTDIHLYGRGQGEFEPSGNIANLYIFGFVALVVLTLACVNFVNLTTARSANRAKEVGVRKVLGSQYGQLVRQFTLESIVVVAVSTLIALGLLELARIPFTALTGKALSLTYFLNPVGIVCMIAFVFMLGVIAGSYPALFISRLKPTAILKGQIRSGFKSSRLRNGLVTLQFVVSIALITCTLVVQHQLEFMRSKKLGFNKENVVVVRNANQINDQQSMINELNLQPFIHALGGAEFRPIDDYDGTVGVTEDDHETRKLIRTCHADFDYLKALQFDILSGRNFSRNFVSDSSGVILNKAAAEYLFETDALGKKIYLADRDRSRELTVIGIVGDFNFQSLKSEVEPLVFMLEQNQPFLHIRLNPGNYEESLSKLETIWHKYSDVSFDYAFLDESYNNLFIEETRLGTLFSVFTGLALFIACLGLLGLAAYMNEQRSKELSIRKVLGASLPQIVVLLSKDFTRLILIAAFLAFPLAYYVMNLWLNTYAYRVPMSAAVFLISGILVFLVALLTVSYQSIKAALVNPVQSLKNE